jgi:hypothetical protein
MNILGGFIFGGIQKMLSDKSINGGNDIPGGIQNGGNTCWLAACLQAYRNINCYKNMVLADTKGHESEYIKIMKLIFKNSTDYINNETTKQLGNYILDFCVENTIIPNMNKKDLEKEFKKSGQHDMIPFQSAFNHYFKNNCQLQSYTLYNITNNKNEYTKKINSSENIDIIIDENKTLINNKKYDLQKIIEKKYLRIPENNNVINILNMGTLNLYIDKIKVSDLKLFNNKFTSIMYIVQNYIKNKNNKDIWINEQNKIYETYKIYSSTDQNFDLFTTILKEYNNEIPITTYFDKQIKSKKHTGQVLFTFYKLYYYYYYYENSEYEIDYINLLLDTDTNNFMGIAAQKEIIEECLGCKNFDRKIFNGVCFPEEIIVNSQKYILKSIIIHFGNNEGGHYTSIVRKPNGYYYCDDDNVNGPFN